MTRILFAASALWLVSAYASPKPQYPGQQQTPYCQDGGQLHCCAATFNGGLAPVKALSNLACYDLTPATVNCIIAEDSPAGCTGSYQCCQVNTLVPVAGLFCSPYPGGCVGEESGGACTNLLANQNGGRFGQCSANDITDIRNGLGLGPLAGGLL